MKKSNLERLFNLNDEFEEIQERYNKGEKIADEELIPYAKTLNISLDDLKYVLEEEKNGHDVDLSLDQGSVNKSIDEFDLKLTETHFSEETILGYMEEVGISREAAITSLKMNYAIHDNLDSIDNLLGKLVDGELSYKVNKKNDNGTTNELMNKNKSKRIIQNEHGKYKSEYNAKDKKYKEMFLRPNLSMDELQEISVFYDLSIKSVKELWKKQRLSKTKYKKYLKSKE